MKWGIVSITYTSYKAGVTREHTHACHANAAICHYYLPPQDVDLTAVLL